MFNKTIANWWAVLRDFWISQNGDFQRKAYSDNILTYIMLRYGLESIKLLTEYNFNYVHLGTCNSGASSENYVLWIRYVIAVFVFSSYSFSRLSFALNFAMNWIYIVAFFSIIIFESHFVSQNSRGICLNFSSTLFDSSYTSLINLMYF